MTEPVTEAKAVITEYAAAVLAKDPKRLAALYAPDVRVFDAWGVWSVEGRDTWGRNLQDWLGSLGDERVEVGFDDVRLVQQDETATISAIVSYSAANAAGQTLRSMQNRLSWFLAKADGRWAIAHEHTSAPIGFEDQKAILHRDQA